MAIKRKTKSKKQILPNALHNFIARRIIDSAGLSILILGSFIIIAMLSYNHTDSSVNTAIGEGQGVSNVAGPFGSNISDILAQSFGFGALMLGLLPIIWGLRLFKRKPIHNVALRITAYLFATISLSIGLTLFPSGAYFDQPYLGGSAGMLITNAISGALPSNIAAFAHTAIPLIFLVCAAFMAALATGLQKNEWLHIYHRALSAVIYCLQLMLYAAQAFKYWLQKHGAFEQNAAQTPLKKFSLPKIKPFKPSPLTAKTSRQGTAALPPQPQTDTQKSVTAPSAPTNPVSRETPPPAPESEVKKSFKVMTPKKQEKETSASSQISFALDSNSEWELPSIKLLAETPKDHADTEADTKQLESNALLLQDVLSDFNVKGEISAIHPGPVVTLYELEPAPGTKSSRVINLSDDIARSMSAVSVRAAVVPGRNVIGIELPNKVRETVYLRDLLESRDYNKSSAHLPLILGNDIGGHAVIADLSKMPHLLVAGTTGSGKSVAVNTMILSLLFRLPPEKCRFIMIDPKMLELSVYDDIPHLLAPVVTEPGKAIVALKWVVQEMENRYRSMSKLGVRNIDGYNKRVTDAMKKGEVLLRKVQTGFDAETGRPTYEDQPLNLEELPYIVVVVDEFADLMLVAGKDVENAIQRLAQMARAAGIHLIMATQRPSVDVITGVIKANFPTRISFSVTSKIDSRTILGEGGAEQLLGMGDMLYMAAGGRITRVHGPFASDGEVEKVVKHIKGQGAPAYLDEITDDALEGSLDLDGEGGGGADVDELYDNAVAIVARERRASTSYIQRHLQIGYNRAARIIEEMERQGVVGPANHVGKREILVGDHGGEY
jgi:S-DNA-T family DNA segregation ATPase FtsK/SpoIIIE